MTKPFKKALNKGLLKSLNPSQIKTFLSSLSRQEKQWLLDYWALWAREDQLPPEGAWTIWLILGGRGAGKTRAGAEWVRGLAKLGEVRIALVGETYIAARAVMVEGASGILNISPNDERPIFLASRRQLRWKSGAVADLFSAANPEALRGPQFHFAWSDELCKWSYPQQTWDMLQFALRLGVFPRQVITTTPRPMKLLKKIMKSKQTILTRASTYANRDNLSQVFFDEIIKNYEGTRLGRQELDAELIEDNADALWTRAMIDKNRQSTPKNLTRKIVAIDPPATGNRNAAACGIIVAGISEDKQVYVLGDYSQHAASPVRWAKAALRAFKEHHADRMIAEVNQGGDMVEAVIRQLSPDVSFRAVRAIHGKRHRAEPVAALYEQGKVHHCDNFTALEDQLCSWGGSKNEPSPDRLDALVWAITELVFGASGQARLRGLK